MKVLVEGVWVQLTPDQVKYVEDQIKKRENEQDKTASSFKKVLAHFGFYAIKGSPRCYFQDDIQWFAEIQEISVVNSWQYVWATGNGIPDNGFPGGHRFDDPQELFKKLAETMSKFHDGTL